MRTKPGKKKKNLVKDMRIDEVSFCGKGMNPGAHVALFKSVDPELVKATFTEVVQEMKLAEGVEEIIETAFEMNHALARSLFSILGDDQVLDKKDAIKASLGDFVKALQVMSENATVLKAVDAPTWLEENREEELGALVELINTTLSKEDETMSKELEAKLKKAEQEKKDAEARLAKAEKLAGMTDAQKSFMKSLPEGEDQENFLALSPEEMDAQVKKAQEGDEQLIVAGVPVLKSDVGDSMFAILKAQQEENDKLRKKNEKAAEIAVAKAFQSEAERTYPHLPGSVEHKGALLKAIDGMPSEEKTASLALLKAADEALAKGFDEEGHGVNTGSDAEAKLKKMAEDHAEKKGITLQKAYSEVMDTPEGAKLYEQSLTEK